jgi:hypothetical protein
MSGLDHVLSDFNPTTEGRTSFISPEHEKFLFPPLPRKLETILSVSTVGERSGVSSSSRSGVVLDDITPTNGLGEQYYSGAGITNPDGMANEQLFAQYKQLSRSLSESGTLAVAPAWYIWMGPALICALMYALYNIW